MHSDELINKFVHNLTSELREQHPWMKITALEDFARRCGGMIDEFLDEQ